MSTPALETDDGTLTPQGAAIVSTYALEWVTRAVRDLALERVYPELEPWFYDVRSDPLVAAAYALPSKPTPTPV